MQQRTRLFSNPSEKISRGIARLLTFWFWLPPSIRPLWEVLSKETADKDEWTDSWDHLESFKERQKDSVILSIAIYHWKVPRTEVGYSFMGNILTPEWMR